MKVDKLSTVLDLKYGKDHKSLKDGSIPCIGSGGIMRYVDTHIYDQVSILIPRKGSLNNIMFQDQPFWTVDTMFWSIIDEEKVNPKFLFYQLTLVDYKNLNVGSAVPSLTVPVINEIEINLPEPSVQDAIADILSSLDNKKDLLFRQNQTLENMAETLFNAWFEDKSLDNKISDLIDLQNGYAFKSKSFQDSGEHRVLKIKNISGGIVDIETSDFVSSETVSSIDTKFKITTGDVLFAMTGAKIGKMGIIPKTNSELWLNQRVGLFKEKYKGSRFLAYLHLKSDYGKDYIDNAATGSAQPNISGTGIEECEFPEISEQEIIEYSSQLAPLYEKLIFNLGQIQKLESLRDTLLPKLMSGEVRLETNG